MKEQGQLSKAQIDARVSDIPAQRQYLTQRIRVAERHSLTPDPYAVAALDRCTASIDHLHSIRALAPEVT